ncbi:MAG: Lrp/AsnC family transcriptional regulator [Ramlibacter sp.]|nr:Lrp/AsnC family transcriptional regulator [Ramlibacter sp.]
MNQLDRHDILLLTELQRDARQTVQQLAAAVGLSSTPCWKRVKEMEASGIIRGYTALVDREKVGLTLCVLAEVNLTRHNEDDVRRFERAVLEAPQIVSCHATTGQAPARDGLQAAGRDARAFQRRAEGGEGGDAVAAGAGPGAACRVAAAGRARALALVLQQN